jgi:hypothetical protein
LYCWNDEVLNFFGNTLGTYIDKEEPKDGMMACMQICVEVDLEKGLPEAMQLVLDDWNHIQVVDYEQLPSKCKQYHEYGHFSKKCPINVEAKEGTQEKEDQWHQVKKKYSMAK